MREVCLLKGCINKTKYQLFVNTAVCGYLVVSKEKLYMTDGVFTLFGFHQDIRSCFSKYQDDIVIRKGKVVKEEYSDPGSVVTGDYLEQAQFSILTTMGLCIVLNHDGVLLFIPRNYLEVFNEYETLRFCYDGEVVYFLKEDVLVGSVKPYKADEIKTSLVS